jgi:hypothetical protein
MSGIGNQGDRVSQQPIKDFYANKAQIENQANGKGSGKVSRRMGMNMPVSVILLVSMRMVMMVVCFMIVCHPHYPIQSIAKNIVMAVCRSIIYRASVSLDTSYGSIIAPQTHA